MSLRQNRNLRAIARRLPIISAYERRIEETTASIEALDKSYAAYREDHRLWAPIGHFYSPFVDPVTLEQDVERWCRGDATRIPGVDLNLDAQWALLSDMDAFASSVRFATTEAEARSSGYRYWTENPAYGDTDARFLTAILQHFKPKRLIEFGCGYSSAVTLDARDRFLDGSLEITFLDPYPQLLDSLVRESDRASVTVLAMGTQQANPEMLATLEDGDVLFIDSTHIAKPGSDVNHIFSEILPALRPGVLIHLHDIFPLFEYPPDWIREQRAWTEQYVLRAFLQYNSAFEILLWPGLLWALDPAKLIDGYPAMATNSGGAMWMRKVA
jgi:predicted O-methyltransferase YrrM